MIREFVSDEGRLRESGGLPAPRPAPVWIDLLRPTQDEESAIEQRLGIDIPTREDMEEIEISSRLYHENGASFMTATLPAQADEDAPEVAPVTFVLTGDTLVTIRFHEPRAFQTFPIRAQKAPIGCESGEAVLVALLEAVVDRLADILERVGRGIDRLSREVFRKSDGRPTRSETYRSVLESIGREGELISHIRESLLTFERLIGFLGQRSFAPASARDLRERVRTLGHDIRSLADHANFLSQKINLLLEATLGMINIEQNAIIKIFSVAAVVFLPPTLIASVYGMNFDFMPELGWPLGYPFAVLLMLLSAILPYVYFKHRGWL